MIITRTIANQVAKKVLKPLEDKKQSLLKQRDEMLTHWYESTIPEEVLSAFSKFPEYFRTEYSNIIIRIHHSDYDDIYHFSFTKTLPFLEDDDLHLPEDETEIYYAFENQIQVIVQEYELLSQSLISNMLELASYAAIRKALPITAPHLPEEVPSKLYSKPVLSEIDLSNKLNSILDSI